MMRERGNNIEKIEMLLPSTKLEIRKNELLQTADLYLRNKGLEAIARNFPNLTELNVGSLLLIQPATLCSRREHCLLRRLILG